MNFLVDQNQDHLTKFTPAIRRYISLLTQLDNLEKQIARHVANYQADAKSWDASYMKSLAIEAKAGILIVQQVQPEIFLKVAYPNACLLLEMEHLNAVGEQILGR